MTLLLVVCGGGGSPRSVNTNPTATVPCVGILSLEREFESAKADFYFVEGGVAVSGLHDGTSAFNTDQCRRRGLDFQPFAEPHDNGRTTTPYPSSELNEPMLVSLSAGDSVQFFNGADSITNGDMPPAACYR